MSLKIVNVFVHFIDSKMSCLESCNRFYLNNNIILILCTLTINNLGFF